jgi:hypothetical protein
MTVGRYVPPHCFHPLIPSCRSATRYVRTGETIHAVKKGIGGVRENEKARARRAPSKCYTLSMFKKLCDKCGAKLEGDPTAIELRRAYTQTDLCSGCGAGVVEMLKDMHLIKELDTIR